MKPALAKVPDVNPLEDLGRATLQVVHDLKNQLNGLKLYATFLRKRLARDDQTQEERETLAKLIAGLDRAATDLTVLVRYARPLDLKPHTCDLRKIIAGAVRFNDARNSGALAPALNCEIENGDFPGQFDPPVLAEAFEAITDEAVGSVPQRDVNQISLHVRRADSPGAPQASIEWRGVRPGNHNSTLTSFHDQATVHMALAARIIEGHGGQIERDPNVIRVSLPLSE